MRADIIDGTHAIVEARRDAWRLEETLWAAGRIADNDAGTLALVREHKETVRGAGGPAQAARLPGARRLRGLVDRLRGPHGRAPPGPARAFAPADDEVAAAESSAAAIQTVGPPSQPRL